MAHKPQRTPYKKPEGPQGSRVEVRDNNMGQAMRRLKKLLNNEGVFKEMRDRTAYMKPSAKRKAAKAAAIKRHKKDLAKNKWQ